MLCNNTSVNMACHTLMSFCYQYSNCREIFRSIVGHMVTKRWLNVYIYISPYTLQAAYVNMVCATTYQFESPYSLKFQVLIHSSAAVRPVKFKSDRKILNTYYVVSGLRKWNVWIETTFLRCEVKPRWALLKIMKWLCETRSRLEAELIWIQWP